MNGSNIVVLFRIARFRKLRNTGKRSQLPGKSEKLVEVR